MSFWLFSLSVFLILSSPSHADEEKVDDASRHYILGENISAIAEFEQTLKKNPNDPVAESLLVISLGEEALQLYEENSYEEAGRYLSRLLQIVPDDPEMTDLFEKTQRFLAIEKSGEASGSEESRKTLERLIHAAWQDYQRLNKDDTDLRFSYVKGLLLMVGPSGLKVEEPLKEYFELLSQQEVMRGAIDPSLSLTEQAQECLNQGKSRLALELCRKALKEDPKDKETLKLSEKTNREVTQKKENAVQQARVLVQQEQLGFALIAWEQVLELDPVDPEATKAVLSLHRTLNSKRDEGIQAYVEGKYEKSVRAMEELLRWDSQNIEAERYLDKAKLKLRDRTLDAQKETLSSYLKEAKKLFDRGIYVAAIHQWQRVLGIDPKNKTALDGIQKAKNSLVQDGLNQRARGELARAIETWKMALIMDPDNQRVKKLIASAQKSRGASSSKGEVVLDLNKMALIEKLLTEGVVLYRENKLKEAMVRWNQVLRIDPHHFKAQRYIERAEEKLKTLKEIRQQGKKKRE